MRRLKRYQIAKHDVLIIKYEKDTRYDKDANIISHDKQTMAAVSCLELSSLVGKTDQFSVIGIDEGQFFPDCVTFAENMANAGKIVIVAALDGSFERVGFGNILDLVPLAESVRKLNAVCMRCFEIASFTKRIGAEKELEVIGGADKYMAVCRRCYFIDDTAKTANVECIARTVNSLALDSMAKPEAKASDSSSDSGLEDPDIRSTMTI